MALDGEIGEVFGIQIATQENVGEGIVRPFFNNDGERDMWNEAIELAAQIVGHHYEANPSDVAAQIRALKSRQ